MMETENRKLKTSVEQLQKAEAESKKLVGIKFIILVHLHSNFCGT